MNELDRAIGIELSNVLLDLVEQNPYTGVRAPISMTIDGIGKLVLNDCGPDALKTAAKALQTAFTKVRRGKYGFDRKSLERLMKPFVNTNHYNEPLRVYARDEQSGEIVATDGGHMAVLFGEPDIASTKKDLTVTVTIKGKEEEYNYPDYKQVIPNYRKCDVPKYPDGFVIVKDHPIEEMLYKTTIMRNVMRYRGKEESIVCIHLCKGSVEMTCKNHRDILGEVDENYVEYAMFRANYFRNTLQFLYNTGSSTFTWYMPASNEPCVIYGNLKNCYVVLMPYRVGGDGIREIARIRAKWENREVEPHLRLKVPFNIEYHNDRVVFQYNYGDGETKYYVQSKESDPPSEGDNYYAPYFDKKFDTRKEAVEFALSGERRKK